MILPHQNKFVSVLKGDYPLPVKVMFYQSGQLINEYWQKKHQYIDRQKRQNPYDKNARTDP